MIILFKVKELKLDTDETMVLFDITSLFTSIHITDAVTAVRKILKVDISLSRTSLTSS